MYTVLSPVYMYNVYIIIRIYIIIYMYTWPGFIMYILYIVIVSELALQ